MPEGIDILISINTNDCPFRESCYINNCSIGIFSRELDHRLTVKVIRNGLHMRDHTIYCIIDGLLVSSYYCNVIFRTTIQYNLAIIMHIIRCDQIG